MVVTPAPPTIRAELIGTHTPGGVQRRIVARGGQVDVRVPYGQHRGGPEQRHRVDTIPGVIRENRASVGKGEWNTYFCVGRLG